MSQHSLRFTNERIDDKKSIKEEIATSMSDFFVSYIERLLVFTTAL